MPANRPLLARFGFSFIIVGLFLAYEGYEIATGQRGPVEIWRVVLYLVAAVLCFVMGITGIRMQHQR